MRPRVGLQELGQQIEAGGLAGAIRADQSVNGAALDPQIDAIDRDEAGELLGQVLGFEDGGVSRTLGHLFLPAAYPCFLRSDKGHDVARLRRIRSSELCIVSRAGHLAKARNAAPDMG